MRAASLQEPLQEWCGHAGVGPLGEVKVGSRYRKSVRTGSLLGSFGEG